MTKYEFKSARGCKGDPLIQLTEGQKGIVNFLLIGQERELLYFNLEKNESHYDVFDVSALNPKRFWPTRLMHLGEESLRNLSQSTKVSLDEIVEIARIERANWQDVVQYARVKDFYQ